MMMILKRMTFITVAVDNDGAVAVDNGDLLVICLKYEKLDVTVNSFQSHNAIFFDVTRGNRI